jgi:hypothetical protein
MDQWARTTNDQAIEALVGQILQLLQHGGNECIGQHRKKNQTSGSIGLNDRFLAIDGQCVLVQILPLDSKRAMSLPWKGDEKRYSFEFIGMKRRYLVHR